MICGTKGCGEGSSPPCWSLLRRPQKISNFSDCEMLHFGVFHVAKFNIGYNKML